MNGFRSVLIKGENSDGKMNGELKGQARIGISRSLALGDSPESIQGQRLDGVRLEITNVS